ncbi:MAG: type II toxin-antitoxin system PemK/MazF family toxin [Candidatus Magasanikbacteria bacterium]|nr:type II toxin-antitoxin system PemK/MazF family toxin [Candidatus Magasanikbacteria bacterium]
MFEIIEVFSNWCKQKIGLHVDEVVAPLFKQGEVWWCSIGMNAGGELYGKGDRFQRPVLVLKKFSRTTFLGLPLTQQEKTGTYFVETNLGGVRRWIILSQARTLDARRLIEPIGRLRTETINGILSQFIKVISS